MSVLMYVIRSGSSTWQDGGQLHRVVKIIIHEDYGTDNFARANHDIAIMKVRPKFELDNVKEKIIKLADKSDIVKPGDNAYLTGWGYTIEKNKNFSIQLQGLHVEIMDFKQCSRNYAHFGSMTKHNICAKHPSGIKDICNGDSGGPLVVNGKLVGIVSWSGGACATPGLPGVYTDVAKYRDWIDQQAAAL